jgi:ankyrin repeat protein
MRVSFFINLFLITIFVSSCNSYNVKFEQAVKGNNISLVESMVQSGVDINQVRSQKINDTGGTALHDAIRNHNPKLVKALLDHGADTNLHDGNGFNALSFTIANTCSSKKLLDKKEYLKVRSKNLEIVELLLVNGASILDIDLGGSIVCDEEEIALALLSHYSAAHSKPDLVEYMWVAAEKGMSDLVYMAIKKEIQLNKIDVNGNNILTFSIPGKLSLKTTLALIDAGVDYNFTNRFGASPLLVAAKLFGSNEDADKEILLAKMAYLISIGADPSQKDSSGNTVYSYVRESKDKLDLLTDKYSFPCKMHHGNWYTVKEICKNGVANGSGVAFNRVSRETFTGKIEDGYFKQGKLVNSEDQLVFGGKFSGDGYSEGDLYDSNTLLFRGRFKNGLPDGKGYCLHNTNLEECRYQDGKRVDQIYLARLKQEEDRKQLELMQFCQTNPMPVDKAAELSKALTKPCHSEVKEYEKRIEKYDPKNFDIEYVSTSFDRLAGCIDRLGYVHKSLAYKSKKISAKADEYNCKPTDPIYHNIKVFNEDLDHLERGVDFAKEIKGSANDSLMQAKESSDEYEQAVQSARVAEKERRRQEMIGAVVSGINNFGEEYSRIHKEQSRQLAQAQRRNIEMSKRAQIWAKENQKRFAQGKSIADSRYINKSGNTTPLRMNSASNNETELKGKDKIKTLGIARNTHNLSGCRRISFRGKSGKACIAPTSLSSHYQSIYEPDKVCMKISNRGGTLYMKAIPGREEQEIPFTPLVVVNDGTKDLDLANGYHMVFDGMHVGMMYEEWYPSQGRYGTWRKGACNP